MTSVTPDVLLRPQQMHTHTKWITAVQQSCYAWKSASIQLWGGGSNLEKNLSNQTYEINQTEITKKVWPEFWTQPSEDWNEGKTRESKSYFYGLSELLQLVCLHKFTSKKSFRHSSYFVKFCLYFWTKNLEEIGHNTLRILAPHSSMILNLSPPAKIPLWTFARVVSSASRTKLLSAWQKIITDVHYTA